MPTLVDRYQIGDMLYSDATVVAYHARDHLLNRAVTVEMLQARLATDSSYIERLLDKARRGALLRLPHVAALYDQQTVNERPFLVLEEAAGPSLDQVAPLEPDAVIALVQAIADTVRAAITRGQMLPTINEHTIHLGPEGRVQILDFGLDQIGADHASAVMIVGNVLCAALGGDQHGAQNHPLYVVAERASHKQYASLDALLAEIHYAYQRGQTPTVVVPRAVPLDDDIPVSRPASGPLPSAAVYNTPRRPWTGLIVAAVAALALVLGGVVLANRGDQVATEPSASAGALASPTDDDSTPASTAVDASPTNGDVYVVNATGSPTLVVRAGPGLDAERITSLTNGTIVEVISPPQRRDNYNWVRIRTNTVDGWCVFEALRKQ